MPTGKPPPGCVAIEAVSPKDGKRCEVFLRQSKIEATAKRGMGAARELAYLVPFVLQNPNAVYRGVREEGESQWLCYAGSPPDAYNHKTGERLRPWAGQVFLVFLDDDRIIYNWRWDKADADSLRLPADFARRFEEQVI
jgi:hypothetical protein